MNRYDCVIVGAGPAGIGIGCVLQDMKMENFAILERNEIGSSFRKWPKEMRMITPSFPGNAYGMLDLNAVALQTSPAYTLGTEHPTGEEFADYLKALAEYKNLPVRTGVDIQTLTPLPDGGFQLVTSGEVIHSRFVIWAAGEFQYPKTDGFPGSEFTIHNSLVTEWSDIKGDEAVVIGGYESGADAAIHLCRLGKKVTIIDRNGRWLEKGSSDPSVELSPYTKDRLEEIPDDGIDLLPGYEVHWLEPMEQGGYLIYCEDQEGKEHFVRSAHPPILATGFKGSVDLIRHLFDQRPDGQPLLSKHDESTITPGLFLSGPSVVHDDLQLCFIYKFRQRYAVIAEAIGKALELDTSIFDQYRRENMMLEDLSCCAEDCVC